MQHHAEVDVALRPRCQDNLDVWAVDFHDITAVKRSSREAVLAESASLDDESAGVKHVG